jgi:hypothetical protein
MSYFRDAQNQAHPNKTNTIMLGIVIMQIGLISIQIWFLFGALNNALRENFDIAFATFIGSLILFIASFFVIRFLPDPRGQYRKKRIEGHSRYK